MNPPAKPPRQVLILRHSPIDGPGHLTHYFRRSGWETQLVDAPHADFSDIDPASADLVVALGSGLSVYDQDLFPFIGTELGFLQRRIAADRPILGICFGAQMLASALGARVYRAEAPEIGWFPLEITPEGMESPLRELAPTEAPAVMHWHQDTFDLPPEASRLARSALCDVQAFSRGPRLLGLQFHPEVTLDGIEHWLAEACFASDQRVAAVTQIRAEAKRHQPAMQVAMHRLLDDWLRQADL